MPTKILELLIGSKRILLKLLWILIFILIVTSPMWSVALGWWLTEVTVHASPYKWSYSYNKNTALEHRMRGQLKKLGLEVKYDIL